MHPPEKRRASRSPEADDEEGGGSGGGGRGPPPAHLVEHRRASLGAIQYHQRQRQRHHRHSGSSSSTGLLFGDGLLIFAARGTAPLALDGLLGRSCSAGGQHVEVERAMNTRPVHGVGSEIDATDLNQRPRRAPQARRPLYPRRRPRGRRRTWWL